MKKMLALGILFLFPLTAQTEPAYRESIISFDSQSGQTILHTVGVGFEPRSRSLSAVQKRLLAKRAAMVHGYRNLVRAANQIPFRRKNFPYAVEETSGFIKGVEVDQVRFFGDGKVEVDMRLPLNGNVRSFKQVQEIFIPHEIPVYEIKKEKKYISKEEYEELFRQ